MKFNKYIKSKNKVDLTELYLSILSSVYFSAFDREDSGDKRSQLKVLSALKKNILLEIKEARLKLTEVLLKSEH